MDLAEVNESDPEFIAVTIRNAVDEEQFNLLAMAHDIAKNFLAEFVGINEKTVVPTARQGIDVRTAKRIMEYYPSPYKESDINALGSSPQGRKILRNAVSSAKEFLVANITALRIIANSIEYVEAHEISAICMAQLIQELGRLIATTNYDLQQFQETTAKTFFEKRANVAIDLLALIMTHMEIRNLKSTIIANDESGFVKGIWHVFGESPWHMFRVIPLLVKEAKHDDIFEVAEQEIIELSGATPASSAFSQTAIAVLKKTELFKILDPTPRKQYQSHFPKLDNYHIFSGTIDEFIERPLENLDALLVELQPSKSTSGATEKKLHKKPRKNNRKKNAALCSKNSRLNATTTTRMNRPEDHATLSTEKEEACHIDDNSWILVSNRRQQHASCANAHEVQSERPSFAQYVDERQIETTAFLGYSFDGHQFDDAEIFGGLGERVNAQGANSISELFGSTRGYAFERDPNLASYFLRFHFRDKGDIQREMLFVSDHVYVSSAHTFQSTKEMNFKKRFNLKNAWNDFITKSELEQYNKTTQLRKLFLKNLFYNKISRYVVGPWQYNALDSEALIFYDLMTNNLASYLSKLPDGATIEAVVMGIKTHYMACYRCGNLIQGFQRAIHHELVKQAPNYRLKVLNHARSLVIIDGSVAPRQPVKTFMRSNQNEVPMVNSLQKNSNYQFRLLIKR